MSPQIQRLLLVVTVLAVALALKAGRYAASAAISDEEGARFAVSVMTAGGWAPVSPSAGHQSAQYQYLLFTRSDCPEAVEVALLPGNSEAVDFVRMQLGDDLAFLQGNRFVERPSGVTRQLSIMTHQLRSFLGMPRSPVLPVLAISPAPGSPERPCRGPSASEWSSRSP